MTFQVKHIDNTTVSIVAAKFAIFSNANSGLIILFYAGLLDVNPIAIFSRVDSVVRTSV
jgi:hypothetical protein